VAVISASILDADFSCLRAGTAIEVDGGVKPTNAGGYVDAVNGGHAPPRQLLIGGELVVRESSRPAPVR
jgi:hypothetical protein